MNKIIFTISLFFCSFCSLAQDIIFKRNGEEISAKVLEVQENSVKYKKTSHLDGPIYSINVSEIFMIKYENGNKDLFNDAKKSDDVVEPQKDIRTQLPSKQQVDKPILSDLKVTKKYCQSIYPIIAKSDNILAIDLFNKGFSTLKTGRTLRTIGIVFSALSFSELVFSDDPFNHKLGLIFLPVGLVGLGVGVPVVISGKNTVRRSIKLYNESVTMPEQTMNFNFYLNYDSYTSTPVICARIKLRF